MGVARWSTAPTPWPQWLLPCRNLDLRYVRAIYYRTAFVHKAMGEIPYRMVTGVSYNRGLMHGKVIVDAANAGLTLRGIGNDDAAFAEKVIAGALAGVRYDAA